MLGEHVKPCIARRHKSGTGTKHGSGAFPNPFCAADLRLLATPPPYRYRCMARRYTSAET